MRRLLTVVVVVFSLALVTTAPLIGATHSFRLPEDAIIAGIELPEGKYKLELDGTNATIIQKGKVVARARVQIREEKVLNPGSILRGDDGTVREIRLKDRVVVFTP